MRFYIYEYVVDKKLLQTASNHPVHMLNKNGGLSTSSFIPFCSFGKDLIGVKMNGLDIPVCNIFKPKNHFDQLCYETDLQELKDNNTDILLKQLVVFFTFVSIPDTVHCAGRVSCLSSLSGKVFFAKHRDNQVSSTSTRKLGY